MVVTIGEKDDDRLSCTGRDERRFGDRCAVPFSLLCVPHVFHEQDNDIYQSVFEIVSVSLISYIAS